MFFNTWFSVSNIFSKELNTPITICTKCAHKYTSVQECVVCRVHVPENTEEWNSQLILDKYYNKHIICNTCLNIHFPKMVKCFCGQQVNEYNTVNLYNPYSKILHSEVLDHTFSLRFFSKLYHDLTHDSSYCTFITDNDNDFNIYPLYENLYVVIQKGCKSCVDSSGFLTQEAMESWNKKFISSHEELSSFIDTTMFTASLFNTGHSFAINTIDPNLQTLVEIKNPGNIGYITNYSSLF